jgi:hypothetical protein
MLERYHRSHPRFVLYVILDIVVSVLLSLVGYQFLSPAASAIDRDGNFGVVAMSDTQLVNRVRADSATTYWIGSMPQHVYTYSKVAQGVVIISYFNKSSDVTNGHFPRIAVETYRNYNDYSKRAHPLEDNNIATIATTGGMTIKFNEGSMNHEIVTFRGKSEIIEIYYADAQLATSMMKDANGLHVVK